MAHQKTQWFLTEGGMALNHLLMFLDCSNDYGCGFAGIPNDKLLCVKPFLTCVNYSTQYVPRAPVEQEYYQNPG